MTAARLGATISLRNMVLGVRMTMMKLRTTAMRVVMTCTCRYVEPQACARGTKDSIILRRRLRLLQALWHAGAPAVVLIAHQRRRHRRPLRRPPPLRRRRRCSS